MMRNGKALLRQVVLSTAFVALGLWSVASADAADTGVQKEKRADDIQIGVIAEKKNLKMPKVVFLHDKHTAALTAQGKDCAACHTTKDGKMSLLFKRENNDMDAKTLETLYHNNCISCHVQEAKAKRPTGPLDGECRSCHSTGNVVSDRVTMPYNNSVHYLHLSSKMISYPGSPDKNCGACHHVFDEKAKKLVWGKNQEDACAACHTSTPVEVAPGNIRPTLQKASHQQCISCHVNLKANKVEAGPITCEGCHTTAAQAKYKVVPNIPRLERGQPDATVIFPVSTTTPPVPLSTMTGGQETKLAMQPVLFNHKAHEAKIADCRACHHVKITSCTTCHTVMGTPESQNVPLAQAMHAATAKQSCIGCHAQQAQQSKTCAACHVTEPVTLSKTNCASCHKQIDVSASTLQDAVSGKLSQDARAAIAKKNLGVQPVEAQKVNLNDIPDVVEIGWIAKEYEPAKMPHRKIVAKLYEEMGDNQLAAVFHGDKTTMCQGCHHVAPASMNPPKCASCHSITGTEKVPALKAAYHLQCMGCHNRMQLAKPADTACADCHKERAK